MSHAIERTSPKGPGQAFEGMCIKCGQTGLKLADGLKACPADDTMSNEAAILALMEAPAAQPDTGETGA